MVIARTRRRTAKNPTVIEYLFWSKNDCRFFSTKEILCSKSAESVTFKNPYLTVSRSEKESLFESSMCCLLSSLNLSSMVILYFFLKSQSVLVKQRAYVIFLVRVLGHDVFAKLVEQKHWKRVHLGLASKSGIVSACHALVAELSIGQYLPNCFWLSQFEEEKKLAHMPFYY
ncbi:hypothetical protein BpHYR1_016382 [Brachionus plicatilis]|uniref:Uncharacterized protein n=1 Tax=Brachionus plicatilis TaxID=10195 RepID=A0A3M7SX46_BRAPC|nr:hypothetical protein BpHYR1_016382 [Brachionus plicatilis]